MIHQGVHHCELGDKSSGYPILAPFPSSPEQDFPVEIPNTLLPSMVSGFNLFLRIKYLTLISLGFLLCKTGIIQKYLCKAILGLSVIVGINSLSQCLEYSK